MTADSPGAVLQVQGLSFGHADQPLLFDRLSFSLPPGLTLLQGDMGSGKTTLLHLLAGTLRGRGQQQLAGCKLHDEPAAYAAQVCWFDPRDAAFDALTMHGLLLALQRRHPTIDEDGWRHHVDAFGLAPHAAKPLYALSTGSRRKAALAAALSCGCALTLLDEPTGGLDGPSLAHLRQALVQGSSQPGRAVLLVCSHGLDDLPLAQTLTLPLR
jgi:ABC-2 type transport system ATP-binding protein